MKSAHAFAFATLFIMIVTIGLPSAVENALGQTKRFSIDLVPGINLLSVPSHPDEEWRMSDLLSFIGAEALQVIHYDTTGSQFKSYLPNYDVDAPLNVSVRGGEGYIVVMRSAKMVTFEGREWDGTVSLQQGINMISVPLEPSEDWRMSDLLAFIGPEALQVIYYDTAGSQFKSYLPNYDVDVPLNVPVRGGEGYILIMSAPKAITFEGNAWYKASIEPFMLADQGCPMAHCDNRMSDGLNMDVPEGNDISIVWSDRTTNLEDNSIWVASNGSRAVVIFSKDPELVVYDYYGKQLWNSSVFNRSAFWSGPMIAEDGSVIAADNRRIVRFDSNGNVVWNTLTPGGRPICPVITDNNKFIFIAPQRGPVSVYDNVTGKMIGELWIKKDKQDAGYFQTLNTPSVNGDRVYVSMEYIDKNRKVGSGGRLVAIDITSEGFHVKWHYPLPDRIARSGASPLRIGDKLYFDSYDYENNEPSNPQIHCIRDAGDTWEKIWQHPVDSRVKASLARDPRGGVWYYTDGKGVLTRRNESTGEIIEQIEINDLLDSSDFFSPSSVMSIGGPPMEPIMIVSVTNEQNDSYNIAINLNSQRLVYKVFFRGTAEGSQAIISNGQDNRVIFTTTSRDDINGGIICLGKK